MSAIRVFQMDDCDWFAGGSLESCIAAACEYNGGDPSDYSDAHELDDEAMDRLIYTDDDGARRTFREQLSAMISSGAQFPTLFATTEY